MTNSEKQVLLEIHRRWIKAIESDRWDLAFSCIDQALNEAAIRSSVEQKKDHQSYVFYLKGRTYARRKEWRPAVKWYVASIRSAPESSSTWRELGAALRQVGKPKWAEKCFLKGNDPMAEIVEEWSADVRRGEFDSAISILDDALIKLSQQNKENSEYLHAIFHFLKGSTYGQKNQLRLSIVSYITAIRINPELSDAWAQLGHILEKNGKSRWAANCFRKEREISIKRREELIPPPIP